MFECQLRAVRVARRLRLGYRLWPAAAWHPLKAGKGVVERLPEDGVRARVRLRFAEDRTIFSSYTVPGMQV